MIALTCWSTEGQFKSSCALLKEWLPRQSGLGHANKFLIPWDKNLYLVFSYFLISNYIYSNYFELFYF